MTSISKNVYIDKLDDIVEKYNTYHRTIKMKPVDVKSSTYILTYISAKMEGPKFKVVDHVRISKYQNIFAKGYVPNWSEEILWLKKLKTPFRGHMLLVILNAKKLLECFVWKQLQKTNQKEFRKEKVIQRKANKLICIK